MRKAQPYTLIELILVITLLSILSGGTVVFVVELVKAREYVALQSKAVTDSQWVLQKMSRYTQQRPDTVTVSNSGKTISFDGTITFSWDDTTGQLLENGTLLLAEVEAFNVSSIGNLLEFSVRVTGGPNYTVNQLLR